MDAQTRMVLQQVPTTYEGYASSRRGYGFTVQLTREQWQAWHDEDNRRLGPPPVTRKLE